jgi:hypothetical protein
VIYYLFSGKRKFNVLWAVVAAPRIFPETGVKVFTLLDFSASMRIKNLKLRRNMPFSVSKVAYLRRILRHKIKQQPLKEQETHSFPPR